MMTCKEVSTALSMGVLDEAPLRQRAIVRLHVAMCGKCSTFRRWLQVLGAAARAASAAHEHDAPADLEARIVRRLERHDR